MRPENRALLVIVVAVVALAAIGGGYFLVTPSTPTTLIFPWGTVFQVPSADKFEFNVTPPGGTLLGAWSSTGPTCVMLFPGGASIPRVIFDICIAEGTLSGTFNENLTSFPSTAYVLWFLSDNPVTVWVTQTIEVVHS